MPRLPPLPPRDIGPCLVETRDAIEDVWGPRAGYHGDEGEWPVRVDEILTTEPDKWVQSACIMCSNGCGVDVAVKDGAIVGLRGREVDRVNKGRLGPKGMYAWVASTAKDRLTTPMIRSKKTGELEPASWDEAMDLIVSKSKHLVKEYTPHSIAFYTSGQLFLEEYHTLAMVGKGGLGALHMDGNTRLCTATAAASMRENFGCDGQPGSYTDIDFADTIFLVGHNMAATQTVLWSRILDRLAGPNPPVILAMDPRETSVGHAAIKSGGVLLDLKTGTNLAMLNGLVKIVLDNPEYYDQEYIDRHTVGIDALRDTVKDYPVDKVAEITGVSAEKIQRAGELLGKSKKLLSTCLQGVYQSNQGTASACQVNNLQLIKGCIGKKGCGVLQMNGQPTAQNNRECGCNGEFPGFRNQLNPAHMQDLAERWNLDVNAIPHWGQPTHIMSILKFIEAGSIKMMWISGTNPAVSLPELQRIRNSLIHSDLFVVAQDIFPNETTALADVVLPAAAWGEKTGCFTNVDRTVHISHKAIEPPGEARSDLRIFADYAHRMGFKDKDGNPLVKWGDEPEKAFEHWKSTTPGRPCDYSGMSYAKLSEGSGIQWPCNEANPDGTERLYVDGHFPTEMHIAESRGNDLLTGTPIGELEYLKMNPNGRAILKHCHYHAEEELTDEEYPFKLSTGRVAHHFHTRTKTGRSKRLQDKSPEAFVQISEEDAAKLQVKAGEHVLVKSRRGELQLPAKIGEIAKGNIFIPFHFGSFDQDASKGQQVRSRTANDLTESAWDFVSKQPVFKGGAVSLTKVADGVEIHAVSRQEGAVDRKAERARQTGAHPNQEKGDHHVHLQDMLGEFKLFANATMEMFMKLAKTHADQMEHRLALKLLHTNCKIAFDRMAPFIEKYGEDDALAERQLGPAMDILFDDSRPASHAFQQMMDLHGIVILTSAVNSFLVPVQPAAQALHDHEFVEAIDAATSAFEAAKTWASNMNKVAGPQTLVVPVVVPGLK